MRESHRGELPPSLPFPQGVAVEHLNHTSVESWNMKFMGPLLIIAFIGCSVVSGQEPDTLPPLKGDQAPKNFEEMWAGFDPRAEPLEVETIKEWEEEDVVLRVVRFRIGVFKGQKAMLAAVYGFPKRCVRK